MTVMEQLQKPEAKPARFGIYKPTFRRLTEAADHYKQTKATIARKAYQYCALRRLVKVTRDCKTFTDADRAFIEVTGVPRLSGFVMTDVIIQRRLHLGYNRAAMIVDALEQKGIIGPIIGSNPREIFAISEGQLVQ